MNIFVLDTNPTLAAQYHCDKHVVKMCLETAQILCSVRHKLNDSDPIPYRLTHQNHPCVLWAGENWFNYDWLCQLGHALCAEYTHRYSKIHACKAVITDCSAVIGLFTLSLSDEITPFAQAMPEQYRGEDAVEAYRRYYREDKMRNIQCVWTKREKPFWLKG